MNRSLSPLLWIVAVGFFMQTLDTTIVNTALPAMARSLKESPLQMHSVILAYSLTMAVLIPSSGWLADRFGTRRIFLTAILLFVTGSWLCASSQTLTQLVMSRVIQACGGAMLAPVGRLAVLRAFPREKFLDAMAFVAIPGMIGPLIGPTLGGWLVDIASWHWIFLINLPVGVVGAIAAWKIMPDARGHRRHFDVMGYLLLAFAMCAVSLSLDGVSELGFRKSAVVVLLVLGLVALVAYGLHATKIDEPIFSLKLFKNPSFRVGLLGNLFSRLGSSSMPFLLPLLLQLQLGATALHAGLTMIPVALSGILAKNLGVPLIRRFGYRRVILTNTVLVGFAMASFALSVAGSEPWWIRLIHLGAFGAVNSFQFSAMNSLTLKDLAPSEASDGNGMLSMVQMLAMSLGVASAGAILATFSGSHPSPSEVSMAFRATFLAVGVLTMSSSAIFWQLGSDRSMGKAPLAAEPTELA